MQQGIARCGACDEYFRLATHLRSDEEIRRSVKPSYSKVVLEEGMDPSRIRIPARGWSWDLWFPATFLLIALVVVAFGFARGEGFTVPFISIVFGLVALAMALPNFLHITIVLGPTITVTWRAWGLARTRRGRMRDLMKITENVVYRRNYQPVYGVGLFFKDGSSITFGSSLKEEERKWLIGELHELVIKSRSAESRSKSGWA